MLCLVCDEGMDPFLETQGYAVHPECGLDSSTGDKESEDLRKFVQKLIRITDATSARSVQKTIGPSEVGDLCSRKIAYRLLDTPEKNRVRDPWPAIVGTAIHQWLERSVVKWPQNNSYTRANQGGISWETEMRVAANALVSGSSDVYDHRAFRVIDWKTAGTDMMKKYRAQGPPQHYIIQAHVYGLGHENAGRQVRDVALVFLPRNGLLSGIYVWRALYRRDVAERALARVEGIGDILLDGKPPQDLPAAPSDNCGFCPWFASEDATMGVAANKLSCPGR